MQTNFAPEQLADAATATSEAVIRKCVHCGFCTATCPTYVLLGDELDSPRGRIYLMKNMLEGEQAPTAEVVKHIDRCLSCLSCMTTCPSDVNYMHLVDHARAYIAQRYRRPLIDRLNRALIAASIPHPFRFRLALTLARIARPALGWLRRIPALKSVAAMLALAPSRARKRATTNAPAVENARGRVVLMQGCAEPVLEPAIREATVRVLARAGFEVVFAKGEGCCGGLVHHMGRAEESLQAARRNVDVWDHLIETENITAIVVTTSGCGTTLKDYGFMLRGEPRYAARAARVSARAKDVSELLADAGLVFSHKSGLKVAYHAACSLQHGQGVKSEPLRLLEEAGFVVVTPTESHLCCGSAGVYNLLQPDIAAELGARKALRLARLKPDVIATGNLGCALQISASLKIPVVHTIQLLDWASGGPRPFSPPEGQTT